MQAMTRFSSGLVWETAAGSRAPLDALQLLASFMATNKVRRSLC
jgi:hypothetical protein